MAFTLEQKNNIDLLKSSPEKFLSKINDGSIKLEEYKDDYLRGGLGISHILIEMLISDFDKYKNVAKEVFSHSNFSLADTYKDNPTPIEYAIKQLGNFNSIYADNTENLNKILKISSSFHEKINDEDFSRVLHITLKNEDFKNFINIFELRPKIINNIYWTSIFTNLITEDKLEEIKSIVNFCSDKTDITRVEWNLNYRNKNLFHEKSNLLVCAIRYSDKIANYFLDELNFPLSGRVKFDLINKDKYKDLLSEKNLYRKNFASGTRHDKKIIYSATLPLNEAMELNKPELFAKILRKTGKDTANNLLYKEIITKEELNKSIYSYSRNQKNYKNSEKVIKTIIKNTDSIFYKIVKSNILETTRESPNYIKLNLISEILGDPLLNYKEKHDFAEIMIPNIGIKEDFKEKEKENENEYIYERKKHADEYTLDNFLTNMYSSKDLNPDDINLAAKILELTLKNPNKPFHNSNMYTNIFYENQLLFNTFIASGLDVNYDYEKNNKINPFHFYCELKNSRKSLDVSNKDVINKNFDTLKTLAGENLYKDIGISAYTGKYSLLTYALANLDAFVIYNLTDKEILNFAKKQDRYPTSLFPEIASHNIETYRYITKRMFDLGFNFFHNDKPQDFYKLLRHHNNTELLNDVLSRENKSINELSKDIEFWKHSDNPDIKDYIFTQNADMSSIEITLKIAEFVDKEKMIFKNYINNGGNINYTNEHKDTILHYLVKNNLYKNATHIIHMQPELSEVINKQNKISLQYTIVSFNRECGESEYKRESFFKEQKEFFEEYLECGKFSSTPKTRNMLMEQIDKYSNIESVIPHLKQKISYKIMEAITKPVDNEKKSVARHKI